MPDALKAGIENLSGYSMDDVQVHYNSSQPATVQAHAYAQGSDIHVAPGQEKYLPHEAWHVVQQKQGRVKPTRQLKGKTAINDEAGLEREADTKGAQALVQSPAVAEIPLRTIHAASPTVQRMPSTFRPHAQPILDLGAGEGEKSKDFRKWVSNVEWLGKVFATKWTDLQQAVQAYVNLPDPVTPEHLRLILAVNDKVQAWKEHHKVDRHDKELNDDEQQKLDAVQRLEEVLPDEIQFTRGQKATPKTEEQIVSSRLDFIFGDALGGNVLDIHSERTWARFEAGFPPFNNTLLQQELPSPEEIQDMDAPRLARLAGARINALRGGESASNKIALTSVQCFRLGKVANLQVNFDKELETSSKEALLDMVNNELYARYPQLALDIAKRVEDDNLTGVSLTDFFEKAGNTYMQKTSHTDVNGLNQHELAQLRQDIRLSPEYVEFLAIAQVHDTPTHTGKDLPSAPEENLPEREQHLLGTLNFKIQNQNAQGQVVSETQNVPNDKKMKVVMAVMTIEKLIGRELGQYPEFILVRKQGAKYRANADSENRYIRYDIDFTMATGVHELGHYFENTSDLDKWFSIYLLLRSRHRQKAVTLGKDPNKVYSNSHPNFLEEPGFLGGIQGLEDRFRTEYTARYYETGHTEMMSMFSERMINRQKTEAIINRDPQAFAVLLKVMRPTALPEWDLTRLGFVPRPEPQQNDDI